jgi:pimeloyl-ACP methyl ester carboxylesterase
MADPMPDTLNPDGTPSVLGTGDVQLTTPGLTGQAELLLPGMTGIRGEEQATEQFLAVLSETGFVEQLTVAITDQAELTPGEGGTRGAGGGTDIVVEVPGPGTGFAQVLLYTAEDGSQTWHLPENIEADGAQLATRGGDHRVYRVPRVVVTPAPDAEVPATRGLITAVGKKLLKVIAFPLIEVGATFVAEKMASRWEARNRPHMLRSFTPADYRELMGRELTEADVENLAAGRALMFVHGTFSRAGSTFRLPKATLEKLHELYQQRVFAFDHPSMSASPTDNARWLAAKLTEQLPPGHELEVDVVAHSQGGLVGRELCEYTEALGLSGRLKVNRLVMVGTPNAGTALADVAQWKAYIDRMTNILQLFPDNPLTDTLDAVLTLLKHVAVGAVDGLSGLRSMDPAGDYLQKRLNRAALELTSSSYLAVAANYEPKAGSALGGVILDGGVDLVFHRVENDLVVPTAGVFTVPGAVGFPIAEPLLFPAPDGVEHLGYFARPEFGNRLLEWLSA